MEVWGCWSSPSYTASPWKSCQVWSLCEYSNTHAGGHILISCKPDSWICAVLQSTGRHGSVRCSNTEAVFSNTLCLDPPTWDQCGTAEGLQVTHSLAQLLFGVLTEAASSACSWKPRTHLISASASYFITCVQRVCSYNLQLPLRACGAESVVTKTTTSTVTTGSNKIFTKVSSERLM